MIESSKVINMLNLENFLKKENVPPPSIRQPKSKWKEEKKNTDHL